MERFKQLLGDDFIKVKLSVLWLFAMLNYIYADIMSLMDPITLNQLLGGAAGGALEITPTFLFLGAVLMEMPIAMIVLSLILPRQANRWANMVIGVIKILAVGASLFVGVPALYYLFFVMIEIATTLYIIWLAWDWKAPRGHCRD